MGQRGRLGSPGSRNLSSPVYEVDLYIITRVVKVIFGVIYNSNHHSHSNRDNRDLIVLPGMVVFIHPKHHLLLHDEEDEEEGGVTDKQNGKKRISGSKSVR